MRIVIDLQSCQSGSRRRGIGRYAMAMTKALLQAGSKRHDFVIVTTDLLIETVADIRRELYPLADTAQILVVSIPRDVSSTGEGNEWRTRAAEIVYADAVNDLNPDAYINMSLFEGMGEDVIAQIELADYVRAAPLYDLIPYLDQAQYLPEEKDRRAYFEKINAVSRCDVVFAISDFSRDIAIEHLGFDGEQVVSVPLGVDPMFRPMAENVAEKAAFLDRFGIKGKFLVNTSPFEARKNVLGLIAGFACLDAEVRRGHQLVIVGRMDEHARLRIAQAAVEEGLSADDVVLTGYVNDDDLIRLYNYCELMVFPSLSEGFGLPPLEAMACGAAVIASNTTSIPEVLGREDMSFDPLDPADIARSMNEVLSSPRRQKTLQAYGIERAKAYTWEKSANTVLKALERLSASKAVAKPEQGPLPQKVSRLGVIAATGAVGSRQSAELAALVRALALSHDTALAVVAGEWHDNVTEASVTRLSLEEMERTAGRYDRILYVCDRQHLGSLLPMMTRRPGGVVVIEGLSPRDHDGGALLASEELQRDLHTHGGFGSIIETQDNAGVSDVRTAAVGAALRATGLPTVVDADSSLGHSQALQTPIQAVVSPDSMRKDFCRDLDISADNPIILTIAENERSAGQAIRAFRRSKKAAAAKAHLVIGLMETVDTKRGVHKAVPRLGVTPGRIVRCGDGFEARYVQLLAAADVVVLAGSLPDALVARVKADVSSHPSVGIIEVGATRTTDGANDAADAKLAGLLDRKLEAKGADPVKRNAVASSERLNLAMEALRRAPSPVGHHAAVMRKLPAHVRGVAPTVDDLVNVTRSFIRNRALNRAPRTYIDLSAFAAPASTRRTNLRVKAIVKAFLKAGAESIHPVYVDGQSVITANQFVGKMIGLESVWIADEFVAFRPGDILISLDVFGGFDTRVNKVFPELGAKGVSSFVVAIDLLITERPDLLLKIAQASLEAVRTAEVGPSIKFFRPAKLRKRAALRPAVTVAVATDDRCVNRVVPAGGDLADTVLAMEPALASLAQGQIAGPAIDALAKAMAEPPAPSEAITANYTLQGHVRGTYSLAIVNRQMATVLDSALPKRVSFEAYETIPVDDLDDVPEDEKSYLTKLMRKKLPSDGLNVAITQHWPVMKPVGDFDLGLVMLFWEETHIPTSMAVALNEGFDAVIAPARSVRKALIDSGVSIPVRYVGYPADLSAFKPRASPEARPLTTFLHVSSCFPRKGVDLLLEAWVRAFTAKDRVRLVIKTFPNPHNDIEARVDALRANHPGCAEIEIVNRDLGKADLANLYADSDVMVLPTRGEGYNLPALEAMAAGLPLIVTGHGGHRDFCGPLDARLIDYDFAPSGSHVTGGHSLWVEPDVDDLVDALKEQVDPAFRSEIDARTARAVEMARIATVKTTWMSNVQETVSSLVAQPSQEAPKTAWITSWGVRCGIAQYSSFLLENFSAAGQRNSIVLSDTRTEPGLVTAPHHVPTWTLWSHDFVEELFEGIAEHAPEAIVIQHQDGLISWTHLADLLSDDRVQSIATVVVLHIARNIANMGAERDYVLSGLEAASRVIVHNVEDLNLLKSYGLVDNVTLMPHGASAPVRRSAIRDLPAGSAPVIGCHGFAFKHKGIDKLIRAAADLRGEWPGLRLRLVTARYPVEDSDETIAHCQALAQELGMVDAIDWHTEFLPVEEINDLLSGCDLLVLPYDETGDSASGAVRIAMASLAPVLATDVKIFAEIGDAIARVESNAPQDLKVAIADLLRDSGQRQAVQSSMQEWLEVHDWKRIAFTLEGMVRGMVESKRRDWDN